jgi:hypothetical protein
MSMLLKLVHYKGHPENEPDFSVYSGITSCHFRRYEDGSGAEAMCYVAEPIKTALVPGFSENEKHISFTGIAYLMNENGRTISTFDAQTRKSPVAGSRVEG